MLSLKY